MSKRAPEARLRAFLALCGSKRVCEHTGGPQPAYRVDGMRIMAEFPKPKDDDGTDSFADVERKQEVRPPASDGCSAMSEQQNCITLLFLWDHAQSLVRVGVLLYVANFLATQ